MKSRWIRPKGYLTVRERGIACLIYAERKAKKTDFKDALAEINAIYFKIPMTGATRAHGKLVKDWIGQNMTDVEWSGLQEQINTYEKFCKFFYDWRAESNPEYRATNCPPV